jgi:hypothetical protein
MNAGEVILILNTEPGSHERDHVRSLKALTAKISEGVQVIPYARLISTPIALLGRMIHRFHEILGKEFEL